MGRLKIKLSYNGSVTNYLTYLIVLVSLFLAFFSYTKASFGIECIFLTVAILMLNLKTKYLTELLPFMIICGITIIMYAFSGQTSVRGFNAPVNHMLKFVYLMFAVAISIGMRELSREVRARVIKWMLASVLISVLISIYSAVFIDRYAIRYSVDRGFSNIIDFGQYYGLCFIIAACEFVFFRYRKMYSVWRVVLISIPILICVALSLITTGVLLTALGIGLAFAVHKYDQSKTKIALWTVFIFALLAFSLLFRAQISDWIYKITEPLNWILRDRLRSVADTIFRTNHGLIYSYDRRDELAGYSLSSFRAHPLFGIGYKEYGYGTIGCHQEWQDLLGVFGIVGTFLFAIAIIYLVRVTARSIDNKTDLHTFYIAVVLFFIFGFLNPCLNLPVLTAVFVVAPNISLIIPWWRVPSLQVMNIPTTSQR